MIEIGFNAHAGIRCALPDSDRIFVSAKDIQALRKREGVSQSILARCLNVTTNYISQLERGAKRPRVQRSSCCG
jgi:DNA-binding transcriptional regulator YiaG